MAAKTTKRRKNTKGKIKKNQQSTELYEEIVILVVLAVCILLVLSSFGLGGAIGEMVSAVLFGLFGFMSYLFPFAVFGMTAFLISNKGNTNACVKVAAGVFLFLLFAAILELMIHSYTPGASLGSYYTQASRYHSGGGFAGGCLITLLCPLIGEIGTYVVLIILSVVCIILITEKSLLAPLGRQSKRAYEEAKKRHQQTAALRARIREEKKQHREEEPQAGYSRAMRKDRKVSGVSFATTLTPENPEEMKRGRRKRKSPEIYELTPDIFPENDVKTTDFGSGFVINRTDADILDENAFEMGTDALDPRISGDETVQINSVVEDGTKKKARSGKKQEAQETAAAVDEVAQRIGEEQKKEQPVYHIPPLSLLKRGKKSGADSDAHLRATALKLEQTLQNFGVGVHVTNASCGPSVTRYELQPDQGVKVSRIVGLADDIKLNLAVADLRIEAPIPGKAAVGIEVPNSKNTAVMLRDLLESEEFKNSESLLSFAAGKDIAGKVVVADIAKMPHLLVAGATGSGKSVCINTLIMSLIYKADPEDVKLILVDPKVVELSVYNGIPHLMIPVVTDPKKAAGALNWAVAEMERRYKLFAEYNVRDLKGFNGKVQRGETGEDASKKLPQIVLIIDELADLMMVAPGEVEGAICRLAQLARAAGLHLILATQRPSVNVITGLIKANMPSRIAFSVSSGVDSRTIIDMNGAEKLLGKGDMLFYPSGYPKPVRVQGSFVSDKEVQDVVDYLISNNTQTDYSDELEEHMNADFPLSAAGGLLSRDNDDSKDTYFEEAGRLIIDKEKASIGMLQRMFKIGFNRAARIMDQLSEAGVVGPEEGTKPRKVLMSKEEFEEYLKGR